MTDEHDIEWKADPNHPLLAKNKVMILLCGLPGSGKSTYGEALLRDNTRLQLISPDLIRAEFGDINDQSKNGFIFNTIVPARIIGANAKGHDILFDATNINRKNRRGLIEQAKAMNYRVEAHVLHTSLDECKRRNAARERSIPEHVIDRMAAQWQEPSLDEGFDKIVEVSA